MKTGKIKVSVIIPIYNASKYLERCLNSVCKQSLKNIEIICIDDGSQDNSAEILRSFEERYKFVKAIYIDNHGAGYARNLGLSVAIGDYVIFLDSDDYFYKDFLESMYKAAVKQDVDIVLCRCEGYDALTKEIVNMDWSVKRELMPHGDKFSWRDNTENLFTFCIGWAWDKLYKREFLNKSKLQFQSLRTTNDAYFVFTSLYKAESIYFLDKRLILQTLNLKSSLSQTRDKSWECFYEAIKAIKEDMILNGVYDDLEEAFMNWCVKFIVWNYTTLSLETKQKMLNKIKTEIEPNLRICDHGLTYFHDRNEFLQYANLVVETNVNDAEANSLKIRNNRKTRIFLWGFCVSREIFNLPNNYIIAGYLFKLPLHTIFSAPLFKNCVTADELEGETVWLKKQLVHDFNKSTEFYLKTHPADYLFIDFADLRLHYLEILNFEGEQFRIRQHDDSVASVNKFLELGLLKKEDIINRNVFEITNDEWESLIDRFITMILKYYPEDRIVVNQTIFCKRYINDNTVHLFNSARYKKGEILIENIEKRFVEKLPKCRFIPAPKNSYADANNHLGLFELHYCQTLYEYKLKAIDAIVQNKYSREQISKLCKQYSYRMYQELKSIDNNFDNQICATDFDWIRDAIEEKEIEIARKRRQINKLTEEINGDDFKYGKIFFFPLYLFSKASTYRKQFGLRQTFIRILCGREKAEQYKKTHYNSKRCQKPRFRTRVKNKLAKIFPKTTWLGRFLRKVYHKIRRR